MTLADASAPECVILALGQNRGGVESRDREKSGIPAARDHCDMTRLFSRGVYAFKMLGDGRVGIVAVNHVKMLGEGVCHLGQIGRASSAEDEDVDLILEG